MPIRVEDLYIGCDHELKFDKARNRAGEYINAATASWQVKKKHGGTVISSGEFPYVVDSDGQYLVTIDKDDITGVVEGEIYFVDVTFTGTDGEEAFFRKVVKAVYRSR